MYGLSGMMTIPMPSFLIEHAGGLVLFDTGIAPEAITDPVAVYGQELADGLGIGGTPEQAVDKQVEALGYKTSDVTHVIASHFHFDHAGGTHLFPDAKHYAGAGELAFARFATPIAAFCYMPDQIERTKNFNWHELPGVTSTCSATARSSCCRCRATRPASSASRCAWPPDVPAHR